MTRANAIRCIVHYLDNAEGINDKLHQAKKVLEDMLSDYPGKKWDERSICAAVEQFIAENDRPPTTKELDALPNLPSHRSVELEFGMKAAQWLVQAYPNRDQLWFKFRNENHTPEEYQAIFISEFNRVKPHSCLEFNRLRNPYYPSWQYTAQVLGVRLWSELLHKCQLEKRRVGERTFTVVSEISVQSEPEVPSRYKSGSKWR